VVDTGNHQVPTNINLSVNHLAINSNTFQEDLSQLDNEILDPNLDEILQQTNNSAPFNTITMLPSTCTSTRFKVSPTEKELTASKK